MSTNTNLKCPHCRTATAFRCVNTSMELEAYGVQRTGNVPTVVVPLVVCASCSTVIGVVPIAPTITSG